MTVPFFHLLQRAEDLPDQFLRLPFAEIQRPRAQRGEQREGDVGGTCAVRRACGRIELPVVRRQKMILLRAVLCKEVPGLPGVFQQPCPVIRRERTPQSALAAEQKGRCRRDEPQCAGSHCRRR